MLRNLLSTMVVAFALGIAGSGAAQPPRNPPPNRPAETEAPAATSSSKFLAIPGLFPLSMTSVQREIGLTAQQKQQLKAISDGYMGTMRRLSATYQQLKPEEQEQQGQDFNTQEIRAATSAQHKAEAVLTPQQLQTVKAVAFQLSATGALSNAELQKKIGLSPEQQQRLAKVFEKAGEKMQQLQRETADETMQVLEEEQKAELKKQLESQPKQ